MAMHGRPYGKRLQLHAPVRLRSVTHQLNDRRPAQRNSNKNVLNRTFELHRGPAEATPLRTQRGERLATAAAASAREVRSACRLPAGRFGCVCMCRAYNTVHVRAMSDAPVRCMRDGRTYVGRAGLSCRGMRSFVDPVGVGRPQRPLRHGRRARQTRCLRQHNRRCERAANRLTIFALFRRRIRTAGPL
jgi:hypothetical protein